MGDKEKDLKKNIPNPGFVDGIIDRGRVCFSITPMDSGFLITDQDTNKRHGLEKPESVKSLITQLSDSVSEKMMEMVSSTANNEYVEVTIIIGAKQQEPDYLEQIDIPQTFDIHQVTTLFNQLMSANVYPQINTFGRQVYQPMTEDGIIKMLLAGGMGRLVHIPKNVDNYKKGGEKENKIPNQSFRDSNKSQKEKTDRPDTDTTHKVEKPDTEEDPEKHTLS